MAYLWRGIKARLRRLGCAAYVGDCSYCREWKAAKRKAAIGCPDDCPACSGAGVRPTAPEATSGDKPPYGNRGERGKVVSQS